LQVCQNCLKKLNYKGAASKSGEAYKLATNFRIDEFFLTYSTLFRSLPKGIVENAKKGYSDDWPEVSKRTREEADHLCKSCRVDLSERKKLLHVHHVNGEKSDNSPGNLIVLCADCHRKEPHHGHVHIKHADVKAINRFRKEQGLLDDANWGKVLKYADSSVEGVIHHCRNKMRKPPEVGYELVDTTGRVCAEVELAWPSSKQGVYIGDRPDIKGWNFYSIEEALVYFGR
jgi:5-methylcytosine-specific restriction endonuclease McrA